MILHGRTIEQTIDRRERATFFKELVVTGGKVPLAMVRKRSVAPPAISEPSLSGLTNGEGLTGRTDPPRGGGTIAPVLLVHGFGQNRYAWHLPSRSLANALATAGYDVFNLDLRGHGRSRHMGARFSRSVDDYVREDLPSAVEEVTALSGGRPVWLIGHSLGGLVSYAAAPRLAGAVAGIVSIGSPYHFARGSLSLSAIAMMVNAASRIRVPILNARVPVRSIGAAMRHLRPFAETSIYPIPLRGWHAGALEPHILDEHLRLAFDGAGLGELVEMFRWAAEQRFGGEDSTYVDGFEKLDIPLLVIAGANDDLAPPASVRPGFERSGSRDKTYQSLPLGHIDLLVGSDAPLMTWPLITRWLGARAA